MGKKYLIMAAGIFVLALIRVPSLYAQDAGDVLRYDLQYPGGDPVSLVMPAVSDATGFGAYQQNPASMAFFKQSFLSLGISDRYVNEKGTYLGNSSNYNNNQFNVADGGFLYKLPTRQGKFVVGGGYSQSHDYNRALSGYGRNNLTTITDSYAQLGRNNPLNQAAYNAYAINDVTDNNGNYIRSESIFRLYLPQGESYPGINQRFNLTERGTLGEFSAFFATEFAKNLFIGASIGVISGNYSYKRHFLEADKQGNYNGKVIDSNNNGTYNTDINRILSRDTIHDSFTAFSARLGMVYQVSPHFNVGAAYQFRNVLNIHEKYGTHIKTTMDNGAVFTGKDLGKYNYKVARPARLNIGVTAKDLAGFTISASAQHVAYSNGHIKFNELKNKSAQDSINSVVASNLTDVYNLRLGVEYKVSNNFTPRIGYAYYPSPTKNVNADRNFYSAGFTARLSENTVFNLGVQLGTWNDQDQLYSTNTATEVAYEKVKHWNIMAGFDFYF